MANFQYTADLINYILIRAREPSNSAFLPQALVYLNEAYMDLCQGGGAFIPQGQIDWLWLRKSPPGVLTLQPIIQAGTATVVHGSTSVTLSVAPTPSVVGRFFRVLSHPDVFRVAAHTAGATAVTLDSPYTGPGAAGMASKLLALEYPLAPDMLRLTGAFRGYRGDSYLGRYEVPIIDLGQMERAWPLSQIESGVPSRAAWVTEDTVRFNRAGGVTSTDLHRLEYDYLVRPPLLTLPGTIEEPLVPIERRYVLAQMALVALWEDKNDERRTEMASQVQSAIASMIKAYGYQVFISDPTFAQIAPRRQLRARRGPLRTESGLLLG